MERQHKTIKTPGAGNEVILNSELTGGEVMDLEMAIARATTADKAGAKIDVGEAYKSRLRLLCDSIVVSIDGKTGNAEKWEALRALNAADYTFVMKEITVVADGLPAEEGKA